MKILKTLYTATLCAAMAVSTSSCLNSWLDQSPADGIDAETAIKNSDDLANVRTGLYAAVKGNSSLINYYGRLMFVYGDMRGKISNMNITGKWKSKLLLLYGIYNCRQFHHLNSRMADALCSHCTRQPSDSGRKWQPDRCGEAKATIDQ